MRNLFLVSNDENSDRRIFRSVFPINLILFLFLSKLNLIERLLTMIFFSQNKVMQESKSYFGQLHALNNSPKSWADRIVHFQKFCIF